MKYNFLKKAIKVSRVGEDLSSYVEDKFHVHKNEGWLVNDRLHTEIL